MQNKTISNYFSFRQYPSEIILSARGNLSEIISKSFHGITAAREYFLTCPMSLK